jgi:hypothetical protein
MKNIYLSLVFLLFSLGAVSQIISIPDASFKAKLLTSSTFNGIAKNSFGQGVKIDANSNGEIEQSEVQGITELDVSTYILINPGHIASLSGIQYFSNLRVLNCWGNEITSIDLTGLNVLEELKCQNNQIATINFAAANQLKVVNCSYNLLNSINTTTLDNVETLFVHENNLTTLDISHLGHVQSLNVSANNFTSLDLTTLPDLRVLQCSNNSLTSLLINNLSSLMEVVCTGNQLTSLNLNGLSGLIYLQADGNNLTTLNLSPLTSISQITLMGNPLTTLNVSGLTTLGMLSVSDTTITAIDCSQSGVTQLFAANCPNLQTINVRNGVLSYSDPDLLYFAFRIYNVPSLISICTDDNEQNQLAYFNYNTSGNVVVYNGPNCNIPVQVNMGISDIQKTIVKLYPNPASDIVNIELSNNQSVNKATINNLLGQTIMTFENTSVLEVSSLAKGTYFVTVETDSGRETKKIIKQ